MEGIRTAARRHQPTFTSMVTVVIVVVWPIGISLLGIVRVVLLWRWIMMLPGIVLRVGVCTWRGHEIVVGTIVAESLR